MRVTIHVTIPDQVLIPTVSKPSEDSFKSVIEEDLKRQLSAAEANAKRVIQNTNIPNIGNQISGSNAEYDNALDVLMQLPVAHRALTGEGIQVSINQD